MKYNECLYDSIDTYKKNMYFTTEVKD